MDILKSKMLKRHVGSFANMINSFEVMGEITRQYLPRLPVTAYFGQCVTCIGILFILNCPFLVVGLV